MEPTTHTPEWTRANRRFYALARQCNLTSEDIAATIAGNYQPRISTRELTADELTALCQALQKRATTPEQQEQDRWRKRLIAAVIKYSEKMGYPATSIYAVSIIERDGTKINRLSTERLRSLYNAFLKRTKDLEKVEDKPQSIRPWTYKN